MGERTSGEVTDLNKFRKTRPLFVLENQRVFGRPVLQPRSIRIGSLRNGDHPFSK